MSEVNQLLGLDIATESPNAYQVFGLNLFESDETTIQVAIQRVVSHMKARKGSTDAAIWTAAAKTVNKAQSVLCDAEKKAEYDRRLRSAAKRNPQEVPVGVGASDLGGPTSDSLNAWLPQGDPFALFDMAAALEQMTDEIDEEDDVFEPNRGLSNSPATAEVVSEPPTASIAIGVPEPVLRNTKTRPSRRKKRFPIGGVVMTLFVCGLFGGLGYAVKLLLDREKARSTVAQQPAQNQPALPTNQPAIPQARERDPVMGILLPETPAEAPVGDTGIRMGVKPDGEVQPDAAMNTSDPDPAPETPAMTPSEPEMKPEPPPEAGPTTETVDAGNKAAEEARAAIRNGDWDKIVPLADKAIEMAATDEQREQALTRKRLVHYANEYQAAIDRSIDGLEATERVEIREGLIVGVVEVTPDSLILRVQGTNKTYERKNLVPILAHAFAERSLPDDNTVVTALRGAWQCLQKGSTEPQRNEAFESWAKIAGKSDDANVDGLQQEVEAIFQ